MFINWKPTALSVLLLTFWPKLIILKLLDIKQNLRTLYFHTNQFHWSYFIVIYFTYKSGISSTENTCYKKKCDQNKFHNVTNLKKWAWNFDIKNILNLDPTKFILVFCLYVHMFIEEMLEICVSFSS